MWPSWMLFCLLSLLQSANTKVPLQLKDGPVRNAGRVEIYYNGTWGSLCDDGLDLNVGHVICRQLNYTEAIAVPCCNAFGDGDGPFLLSDVKCNGTETSLADCEHGDWGKTNCGHNFKDDASVVCKPSNFSISYPLQTRLSYGLVPYAGCIEVNLTGVWGDVWQFHWDREDGQVVCRQLGYPDILTLLWRCSAGFASKVNVVTWMNNMRCLGNETSLFDCVYEQETYSSSNGFDAGVVCSTGNETGNLQIHLIEAVSYGGRLEVFLAGIWGVIDRSSWDLQDAHVACRQLGFPAAEAAIHGATFFFDLRSNQFGWLDDVNCVGNESSLSNCPHVISFTTGQVVDAGIVCKTTNNSGIRVRLAGSNSSFAGRVEVWYAGTWGTIRNTGWDLSASNVVCRQLGYRQAETAILYAVGAFGKGQGAVWFSDLRCEGHESTLLNCSWPRVAGIYWDHDHDAGVVCRKNAVSPLSQIQIRLMDSIVSRAGRVELSYVGVWGTISGVNWTLQDGQVICRQLGYPSILAAPAFGAFGPGDGPTWLSDVQCLGNESMVSECKHGGWSSLYPVHHTDAAVVCGDSSNTPFTDFDLRLVGGSSSNVGRVEVQFGGVWGSIAQVISLSTFGHVVCRQLGYLAASDVLFDSSSLYGSGTGPVWIAYVSCQGNESRLNDCTYRQVYLSQYLEPGVTCSPVRTGKEGLSVFLKIGLPIVSGLLLVAVIVFFYCRCFRGERAGYHPRREFISMSDVSISTENANSKYTSKGGDSACAPEEVRRFKADDWCEISRGQITLGEKIRFDSVGVTFRGRVALDNGNTMDCIVKTTTGELEQLNDECELLNELKIMVYLGHHPNILNIIGACTIRGPTYVIFEDAEHGNLLDYLHENQISDAMNSSQKLCTLHKVEKLRIALDVARGMKFIAEKKCIHRDLAARNIHLGKNGAAKVANIGILQDIHDRTSFKIVSEEKLSVKWMAPESLESMTFSTESDVWSFGILLWEIETGGDMPYQEIESENMLDHLQSGIRMKKPANCSDIIYDLMMKCWHILPEERPTFSELCIVLDTLVTRETIC